MSGYIEEIRQRLLPSSIISRKVHLKQRTNYEFIGLCPFHNEKTPSFTVSDDKKFFHCFGCGENGDIISFVSKIEGISYKEAALKLANENGIVVPKVNQPDSFKSNLYLSYYKIYEYAASYYQQALLEPKNKHALNYLINRGLTIDTINKFRLGYAPLDSTDLIEKLSKQFGAQMILNSKIMGTSTYDSKLYSLFRDRIIFPIINMRKQVIAFGGRALGDAKPKYINSTDNPLFKKGNELYNLCFVLEERKRANQIIVVEGYIDAISLYQAGIKEAVAPLGTAFKLNQLKLIWNYSDSPILFFDNDNAGKLAIQRVVYNTIGEIAHNKTLKIASYDTYKDPDELLKALGPEGVLTVINKSKEVSKFIFDNELLAKPVKTPEQKSNFKKRLDAIADKISDFDLKKQYRNFFFTQFREAFAYKANKVEDASLNVNAILEVMGNIESNYYQLLCVLIRYPKLLESNELWERLSNLKLDCPELEKVRNELLNNYDKIANLQILADEKENLFNQVYTLICKRFPQFLSFKIKESSIKNIEDASVYAIRLLDLINLDMLSGEIQMLSNEIMISADATDFARLSNLKRVYDNLKLELGIV